MMFLWILGYLKVVANEISNEITRISSHLRIIPFESSFRDKKYFFIPIVIHFIPYLICLTMSYCIQNSQFISAYIFAIQKTIVDLLENILLFFWSILFESWVFWQKSSQGHHPYDALFYSYQNWIFIRILTMNL